MALSASKIERVKQEMERLSERIRELEEVHAEWAYHEELRLNEQDRVNRGESDRVTRHWEQSPLEWSPESASVKRASMDLTRSLADLRKP